MAMKHLLHIRFVHKKVKPNNNNKISTIKKNYKIKLKFDFENFALSITIYDFDWKLNEIVIFTEIKNEKLYLHYSNLLAPTDVAKLIK